MGGDAIFVTGYGAEEDTAKARITSDPLWQKAEARGRARGPGLRGSDDLWMLGRGVAEAEGVMDDLEEYLVKE